MQNVYDIAHELVRSLRETDQYKDFVDAKKALDANPQISAMMNDFQEKSMEFQTRTMSGQEPDPDALDQIQKLYGIVMSDPLASSYFNAQIQLQTILGDIFKIISEAVDVE